MEFLTVIIAMLCVYGFYSALAEIRTLLRCAAQRRGKQIDKAEEKEYNNTHTD